VGVGLDQEDPGQQPEADGDDRGIEEAAPVPARAAGSDQDEQAGDQEGVDGQVEKVSHRWEAVGTRQAD
jgi:hypothetical protein